MAKITDVDITSLLFQEGAPPATPAATKWRPYFKTTGLFYMDDAGVEIGPLAAAVSAAAFVGAKVYNSAVQSIGNNAEAIATFDSEIYDTDTIHSTVTNTGRMTIPAGKTGKWRFSYHVIWSVTSATGVRYACLRVNGTTKIEGSDHRLAGSAALNVTDVNTVTASLTAADYVELMVFQNSGGALDSGYASASTANSFECEFLG